MSEEARINTVVEARLRQARADLDAVTPDFIEWKGHEAARGCPAPFVGTQLDEQEMRLEDLKTLIAMRRVARQDVTTMPTPPDNSPDHTPVDRVRRILKRDALEASQRMAGSQFVKLAREPLIALLSRNLGPGDEALRIRIATFLNTEVGGAMLTALLSVGLSAIPASGLLEQNSAARRQVAGLAQELRVRAMADTADLVADVFMGPLREVMATHLQGLGAQEQLEGGEAAMLPAPPTGLQVAAIETPETATPKIAAQHAKPEVFGVSRMP